MGMIEVVEVIPVEILVVAIHDLSGFCGELIPNPRELFFYQVERK